MIFSISSLFHKIASFLSKKKTHLKSLLLLTISKINYTINYKERRPNKNNVTQNVKLVLNIYPVSNFLYKTNKKGKKQ